MAKKVVMRRARIRIGDDVVQSTIATMERFVRDQLSRILKGHIEELMDTADQIETDALYLVPEDTGKLASSISVRVSKSYRYPGIIAEATAHSRYKTGVGGYAGHDYAPIMEYGEEYDHEKEDASAHYLGGPFVLRICELFEEIAGRPLRGMPEHLQHAADYVKGKIG